MVDHQENERAETGLTSAFDTLKTREFDRGFFFVHETTCFSVGIHRPRWGDHLTHNRHKFLLRTKFGH